MLGQVLSFPSRQWLSALPPGVPAHPPAPGPARSPTLAISWEFNSLVLCRAVNTRKRERSTNRCFKMKPMCSSPALWAPAARGTCRSSVFRVVGSGRGTEKLERPSLNLTWRRTGQRGPGRGPDCHRVKLILVDACRRSILCGMCLIVEKPESDSPWKQPGLMFFDVPGPPPPNGAALPLQRGGLCEAYRVHCKSY